MTEAEEPLSSRGATARGASASPRSVLTMLAEPEPEPAEAPPEDDLEGGDRRDEPEPEPEPRQGDRETESHERLRGSETPRQREPSTPRGDAAVKHGATTPGSARTFSWHSPA